MSRLENGARSFRWAFWLYGLLLTSSALAEEPVGTPPRLLLVLDASIPVAESRLLDTALDRGLVSLPQHWRVAVVGARGQSVELSPLFFAKDVRAIRNAAAALGQGDASVASRLTRAFAAKPTALLLFSLAAPSPTDVAAMDGKAKGLHVGLARIALQQPAEAPAPSDKAQGDKVSAGPASLSVEALVQRFVASVRTLAQQQADAVEQNKARAAAQAKGRWTWRHWLYLGGGVLALLVFFSMFIGVWSRGRIKRAAQRLAAERVAARETIDKAHATIVDAAAELLAFVSEVYAIFPCKRCEEQLFELRDVTSNGRSIQVECDACDLSAWAKCCVSEPPADLDQNFDNLRDTIAHNEKAGKELGLKHDYPRFLLQSNAQHERDASGEKIERVIVRERMTMRPKLLIKCAYCNKIVYYDGRCPECGARREGEG